MGGAIIISIQEHVHVHVAIQRHVAISGNVLTAYLESFKGFNFRCFRGSMYVGPMKEDRGRGALLCERVSCIPGYGQQWWGKS